MVVRWGKLDLWGWELVHEESKGWCGEPMGYRMCYGIQNSTKGSFKQNEKKTINGCLCKKD